MSGDSEMIGSSTTCDRLCLYDLVFSREPNTCIARESGNSCFCGVLVLDHFNQFFPQFCNNKKLS